MEEEKKEKEAKSSSHKSDTTNKKKFDVDDLKGEFKKIIWPKRAELIKQTMTVIGTSLFVGVIIFCMDTVFNEGYKLLLSLLS